MARKRRAPANLSVSDSAKKRGAMLGYFARVDRRASWHTDRRKTPTPPTRDERTPIEPLLTKGGRVASWNEFALIALGAKDWPVVVAAQGESFLPARVSFNPRDNTTRYVPEPLEFTAGNTVGRKLPSISLLLPKKRKKIG